MWRGWRGDVGAALAGLALFVVILFTAAGLEIFWKASTCDRFCVDRGNLRVAFIADRLDNWIKDC